MITYLKGVAIALAVAGTALATSGIARADDYGRNGGDNRDHGNTTISIGNPNGYGRDNRDNRDSRDRRDRGNSVISIGLVNIAFGYRDGYWDNGHHWHHWRHSGDYRSYRDENGSHYYNGYHRHYDNNGWQQN